MRLAASVMRAPIFGSFSRKVAKCSGSEGSGDAQFEREGVLESLNAALRLFYQPPYSPVRDPNEFVRNHLKADTVGRMTVTINHHFKGSPLVNAAVAKDPAKIRSFFQNHHSNMPRHERIWRRVRHCERREAIQGDAPALDCFAALAMTCGKPGGWPDLT